MIELRSGRWIFSDTKANGKSGYDEQFSWYSDDRGLNWTGPICMAACEGLRLCEASILPLPDGTLVAFLREDSGVGNDCYKSISTDEGESWEGPYQIPLPGCQRPVAGLLKSGRIMITYRFTQGGKRVFGDSMQNFFAALTDVESAKSPVRSEQSVRIMPIDYDRSPVSDLGYSGWVQFEDGEIYVVSYIVDDAPKGQIRGYSLREDDFLLPSSATIPVGGGTDASCRQLFHRYQRYLCNRSYRQGHGNVFYGFRTMGHIPPVPDGRPWDHDLFYPLRRGSWTQDRLRLLLGWQLF